MTILGIETSCDETSAAVVSERRLLSNVVLTQEIHAEYGGVVPEIASREHETKIAGIVDLAIKRANIDLEEINAVAVTYGAGLMGTLLVGLNFAKGFAIGRGIPFIGVNHLEGHLFANLIDNPEFDYPFLCLLVSGGHTQIWIVNSFGDYEILGKSRDDAAGEAFDKGARILGLGYPGGPDIEKNALTGDPGKYKFTMPIVKTSELDFSFSGIKTALLYLCQKMTIAEIKENLNHICAGYQNVIIRSLIDRMTKAVNHTGIRRFAVAGGVAANNYFRTVADELARQKELDIFFPNMEYCTDNAAMIAMAGYERLINGETSKLNLKPVPNLSLNMLNYE